MLNYFTIGKDQEILFQGKTLSEFLQSSEDEIDRFTIYTPKVKKESESFVHSINPLFGLHPIEDQPSPSNSHVVDHEIVTIKTQPKKQTQIIMANPPTRMDLIIAATYASLVFPHNLNAFPTGDCQNILVREK